MRRGIDHPSSQAALRRRIPYLRIDSDSYRSFAALAKKSTAIRRMGIFDSFVEDVPPAAHNAALEDAFRPFTSKLALMGRRVRRYLRTDERIDALVSLKEVTEKAERVWSDTHQWKWLIIALHSLVQGSCVLALSRGNGLLTLKSAHARAWLNAYESNGPWPDRLDLDFFLELYEKVKTHCSIAATAKHDRAMKKLNDFRNEFIHFSPKGWSLELAGLPDTCLSCLEIARFLLWESDQVFWPTLGTSRRGRRLLSRAVRTLNQLDTKFRT